MNLPWLDPLVVLAIAFATAACNPPDAQALGSTTVGESSSTSTVDLPDTSTSEAHETVRDPECDVALDCATGETCVGGLCSPDQCPSGCCPPQCCVGDCTVECNDDTHCRYDESCADGTCVASVRLCASNPVFDPSVESAWIDLPHADAIALVDSDADLAREILLGTADGLLWIDLEQGTLLVSEGATSAIVVADVDGDGDDDIVARRDDPNELVVLLRSHDGWSETATVQVAALQHVVGDIGSDGVADLVWVDATAGQPQVYSAPGRGDGTFEPPVDLGMALDVPHVAIASSWVSAPDASLVGHVAEGTAFWRRADEAGWAQYQLFEDRVSSAPTLGIHSTPFVGSNPDVLTMSPIEGGVVIEVLTGNSPVAVVPLVPAAIAIDGHGLVLLAGDQYIGLVQGTDEPCYAIVGVPVTATAAAIGDVDGDGASDLVLADDERTHVLRRRTR